MKISVVIPVYNEEHTIREIINRVQAVPLDKEIIAVDDHSTDNTWEELKKLADEGAITLYRHKVNMGKGAACRTGIAGITGDVVIIQDADLEYDPADYPMLIDADPEGAQQSGLWLALPGRSQGDVFLAQRRQQIAHPHHQCAFRYDADRHGNLLQGLHRRYRPQPQAQSNRWGIRPGDHRQNAQDGQPHL